MRPLGLRGQQKDLESQIFDFAAGLFKHGSNERIHKLEFVNALSSFGCYNYVQDQWTSTRQVEMEQKSLFATKNGYLCLAHSSAEIGDSIAVLLGADTACVIRKQDTAYRFITACKIYGLDTVRVLETTNCSEVAPESENPGRARRTAMQHVRRWRQLSSENDENNSANATSLCYTHSRLWMASDDGPSCYAHHSTITAS